MRRGVGRSLVGAGAAILLVAGFAAVLHVLAPRDTQDFAARVAAVETSRVVVDRDGGLLKPFPISEGRWRLPVSLDEVDPRFVTMLTAYEDRRFFEHPGVDPVALVRAAVQLVTHGGIVSGGSTLSMQLARLMTPGRPRTLPTKIVQIEEALEIEREMTKRQILTAYLTLAPYGGNVEGIAAASLTYFGHSPRRLSVAEAALLIALPQSPEARRPDRDPQAARAARDRVLARLRDAGVIDGAEYARAAREDVPDGRRDLPNHSPHLALEVAAAAPQEPRIALTIDGDLQARLEDLVAQKRQLLPAHQSMAILVADHTTGEVLAEIGSAGFHSDGRFGQVDMVRAVRSPGSALKPFIYGLAFEAGVAHPETLIEDRPVDFDGYRPTNFALDFQGTVTVREALQQSLNVPAVRLLDAIGPARLVARLQRAGVHPQLPDGATPGLPIALGGLGLTLDELVTAFAGLAEGGEPVALRRLAGTAPPAGQASEFLDRRAAWLVADVLEGTPPPAGHLRQEIAFKTGTSYGYRDAWSVGFDGKYVVGVWVGRPGRGAGAGPERPARRGADPVRRLRPAARQARAAAAGAGRDADRPQRRPARRAPALRRRPHSRHGAGAGAGDRLPARRLARGGEPRPRRRHPPAGRQARRRPPALPLVRERPSDRHGAAARAELAAGRPRLLDPHRRRCRRPLREHHDLRRIAPGRPPRRGRHRALVLRGNGCMPAALRVPTECS